MRVLLFFDALKRALLSRLGKAVFDEIEHGERLKELKRLSELDAIADQARLRGEDSVVAYLGGDACGSPSSNLARQALTYFEEVIEASEQTDSPLPSLNALPPEELPAPKRRRRVE